LAVDTIQSKEAARSSETGRIYDWIGRTLLKLNGENGAVSCPHGGRTILYLIKKEEQFARSLEILHHNRFYADVSVEINFLSCK
tara:strand:- start:111 stop:362 length:252 start_codon:yes stop_codon:yes gene_type:complete